MRRNMDFVQNKVQQYTCAFTQNYNSLLLGHIELEYNLKNNKFHVKHFQSSQWQINAADPRTRRCMEAKWSTQLTVKLKPRRQNTRLHHEIELIVIINKETFRIWRYKAVMAVFYWADTLKETEPKASTNIFDGPEHTWASRQGARTTTSTERKPASSHAEWPPHHFSPLHASCVCETNRMISVDQPVRFICEDINAPICSPPSLRPAPASSPTPVESCLRVKAQANKLWSDRPTAGHNRPQSETFMVSLFNLYHEFTQHLKWWIVFSVSEQTIQVNGHDNDCRR